MEIISSNVITPEYVRVLIESTIRPAAENEARRNEE